MNFGGFGNVAEMAIFTIFVESIILKVYKPPEWNM